MTRERNSLVARTLVQIDRAFWCIHEHPDTLALLGLPTLVAMGVAALLLVGLWRTWELPGWADFLLGAVVLPWAALVIFTVLPLPCAVFAWRRAAGEVSTAQECLAWCGRRVGRLLSVLVPLGLLWLVSLLLLGIPLFYVWPRTCAAPLVALFEDQPRIFRRSRRLLREDVAVYVIVGLYLAVGLVLGGVVATPRLVLGTSMLGAHVLDAQWRESLLAYLWVFETVSAAVILTALAMSWWIALTLLYHDIRWGREGEDLRQKVLQLRGRILVEGSGRP
jgi:hypothetical protein